MEQVVPSPEAPDPEAGLGQKLLAAYTIARSVVWNEILGTFKDSITQPDRKEGEDLLSYISKRVAFRREQSYKEIEALSITTNDDYFSKV